MKPQTQSTTQMTSKQSSRVPSPAGSNRQSPPPTETDPVAPAEEKSAEVKPNDSIFLRVAAFLLEVNALQVVLLVFLSGSDNVFVLLLSNVCSTTRSEMLETLVTNGTEN